MTQPTDTSWGSNLDADGIHYLPKGTRVRFLLPGKTRVGIDVRVTEDGRLDINATARIAIFPSDSNAIYIQAKEV